MILNTSINRRGGFTLVELLVVIAIIALLMGVLMPALSRAREQGKRAVCLYYQRQIATAWMIYADDNSDKIINGDSEEYGQYPELPCTVAMREYLPGGVHYKERPWVMRDWADAPPCWPSGAAFGLAQKKDQIKRGALFKYVKDVKAYKCPRANADETRSFSVVDQMNVIVIGSAVLNTNVKLIKVRQQLTKTYERMIFVDDGGAQGKTMGGWTVTFEKPPRWWDPPSARHGDGTTFSFVDGHAEYHKWLESSTLDCAKQGAAGFIITPATQTRDIRWAQIAAWGSATAAALNP
jgi:prepilin-type N-terminal cleavage/methylation domain-containing protein/prepilin-type processing-associated H-X9-DG protein